MKKMINGIFFPPSLRWSDRFIIFLSAVIIALLSFFIPQLLTDRSGVVSENSVMGFSEGEIADRNVVANTRIQFIDAKATEALVMQAMSEVKPVFRLSITEMVQALNRFDELSESILRGTPVSDTELTENDSFSKALQVLQGVEYEEKENILRLSKNKLSEMLSNGIYLLEDFYSLDEIVSQDETQLLTLQLVSNDPSYDDQEKTIVPSEITFLRSIDQLLANWTMEGSHAEASLRKTAADLISPFLFVTATFDRLETIQQLEKLKKSVEPAVGTIEEGEYLIVKDYLITSEAIEKLKVLQRKQQDQSSMQLAGRLLFSLFTSIFLLFFLNYSLPKNYRFLQYLLITLGLIILYYLFLFLLSNSVIPASDHILTFFIPIAFFSMILTIICGKKIGYVTTVYFSLVDLLVLSQDYGSFIILLVLGLTGTVIMSFARKRLDIIKSSFLLILAGSAALLLLGLLQNFTLEDFTFYIATVSANSLVSSILLVMFLPIFEKAFNLPTEFRLMELSSLNTKILKRMAVMARGTYSHSVAVADLSESACEKIGANSLLARVGAYYHDIGKIDQAEYFIENQTGENKHNVLKPSLSAAVIKSHVKVGIEKAKEIGLPQEVIDILSQHHGSDIINYFYMEAIKKDPNSKILPKDFSYNGTPPLTKEAAVVMLADSVDAACRTIKQPTTPKLEKMVWKIFTDKINNNQLLNSRLSLSELEVIRKQFLLTLSGRYHTRIEYPELRDGMVVKS